MRKRLPQSAVSGFTFALIVSAIAAGAAHLRAADPVTLEGLLDRAGWYLDYFVDEFENVVAEEHYTQDAVVAPADLQPFTRPRRRRAAALGRGHRLRARHRDLRSDFLLVKSPETEALVPFRDVIAGRRRRRSRSRSASGQAVPDRARRRDGAGRTAFATKARATTSATCAARSAIRCWRSAFSSEAISRASTSRSGRRTRNAAPASRSSTTRRKRSPAMIRGEAGTRSVRRTAVCGSTPSPAACSRRSCRSSSRRSARSSPPRSGPRRRSGIAVPLEMREQYTFANGNRVNTVATYGRFRRFDVQRRTRTSSTPRRDHTSIRGPA